VGEVLYFLKFEPENAPPAIFVVLAWVAKKGNLGEGLVECTGDKQNPPEAGAGQAVPVRLQPVESIVATAHLAHNCVFGDSQPKSCTVSGEGKKVVVWHNTQMNPSWIMAL
jgi:hypothetical protein